MEKLPQTKASPVQVCLMGATTESGNRGVAALAASLVNLVLGTVDSAVIAFLLPARTQRAMRVRVGGQLMETPVVSHRISPRAPFEQQLGWILVVAFLYRYLPFVGTRLAKRNRWARQVLSARLVGDIRGGDSFSDIYGWRRLFIGSLPLVAVSWLRGSFVLFPQTYGPFKHPFSRVFARMILNRASHIYSRDRESMEAVTNLTRGRRKAEYCPDVAFCLEPILPATPAITPPLREAESRVIVGINVNGLMYNGGYNRGNMFGLKLEYRSFLPALVEAFLSIENICVLLIPHTFAPPNSVESDAMGCQKVREAIPEALRTRVSMVTGTYDQHEIKGIIGLCDFFVGSRMHSCIAALSQGIPAIGVAYSKKFLGVFESVGASDWVIDGRHVTNSAAIEQSLKLFRKREALRNDLSVRVQEARKQLRRTFVKLLTAEPIPGQ